MNFFDSLAKDIYKNLIEGNRWLYLVDGLKTTVIVTFFSLIIGFVLGLLIAVIKTSHKDLNPKWNNPRGFLLNLANKISGFYITIIRGTPTTIQLLIMFNIFLAGIDNLKLVATLTFGLNSAAYMAEIFRGGIQSVDKGEMEAARSLGMGYVQMMKYVVIPQAFKNSLPALGNEIITLFKETSVSGYIGLIDLTRGASIIISNTFTAAIPYFSAAMIYLVVVLLLEKLFKYLEGRMIYA